METVLQLKRPDVCCCPFVFLSVCSLLHPSLLTFLPSFAFSLFFSGSQSHAPSSRPASPQPIRLTNPVLKQTSAADIVLEKPVMTGWVSLSFPLYCTSHFYVSSLADGFHSLLFNSSWKVSREILECSQNINWSPVLRFDLFNSLSNHLSWNYRS